MDGAANSANSMHEPVSSDKTSCVAVNGLGSGANWHASDTGAGIAAATGSATIVMAASGMDVASILHITDKANIEAIKAKFI